MKSLKNCILETIIDTDNLLKNKPLKKGNASNEDFFKWLKFNIFSTKFDKYEELYTKVLFRNFLKGKYERYANEYNSYNDCKETEEEKQNNIEEMKKWLSNLKEYERPYFRNFNNDEFGKINKKYYIEASIGYDNSKKIRVFSDKQFSKLTK